MLLMMFFNFQPIDGRVVAVDWAVEKDKYELAQKAGPGVEDRSREDADSDIGLEGDGEEEDEADEQAEDTEGERQMLRKILGSVMEKEDQEEEAEEDDTEEEELKKEAGATGVDHIKASSKKASEAAKMALDAAATVKPRLTDQEIQSKKDPEYLGRTVFIRGLPLDVTQVELMSP
jgi:hypothetical protein